jgi:H/ACA ribonucleoprotein complex subunit 4
MTYISWKIERKLLIKAEDTSDERYGFKPEERPAKEYIKNGLINLDKPSGPSSHEVAAWVKRIMGLSHVGHGGTLEA